MFGSRVVGATTNEVLIRITFSGMAKIHANAGVLRLIEVVSIPRRQISLLTVGDKDCFKQLCVSFSDLLRLIGEHSDTQQEGQDRQM